MPADLELELLSGVLGAFPSRRLLVIGDLMLDEFLWGKVSRISPEAPVPVVNVVGESYYPGGAANVARNAREFGGAIALMGLAGDDAAGHRLLDLLERTGIDTAAVQRDASRPTTVKTRIIARNQQVVRVDRERPGALSAEQTQQAMRHLPGAVEAADAIVVADYGKGFVTQALADAISAEARAQGRVLAIDPHPHTSLRWTGATIVKPNRAEAFLAAGMPPSDPVSPVLQDHPLLAAARRLCELWNPENLLITLGEQGMLLLEKESEPYVLAAYAKDVFDVSGAGDTAIAVLALALAAGASAAEAAELANRASGIAVGKLGTATVTTGELQAAIANS
jgi:D-glycero-beta-D-manno-heptose-7-phosphate kinase